MTDLSRAPRRASSEKPRRKQFWVGLGVGVLVGLSLAGLGTTLAANISLGSQPIEFGQGVASAQACDPSIDITPKATYDTGGDGNHYWVAQYLVFTNVDVASCSGKIFTLSFSAGIPGNPLGYDDTLRPYKYSFPVEFVPDSVGATTGDFFSGRNNTNNHLFVDGGEVDQAAHGFGAEFVTHNVSSTAQNGTFTITIRVLAKDIGQILLETSDQ
jgi:hypothetical protein